MDYAKLQEHQERLRVKAKKRYALARSLGFPAKQSAALASCSEDTIKRIAAERDSLKDTV